MKYNPPEIRPTIVDLFDRQEAVPGIDTTTLVLASEKPSTVTHAVEDALLDEDRFRPREADESTPSTINIVEGITTTEAPHNGIEYAAALSDSIISKRKIAEKLLFRVGTGVGTVATLAAFWTTFGGWLSTPSLETSPQPTSTNTSTDSRAAPRHSAEADETLKRSAEIVGNLGSLVVGIAIGGIASSMGGGHLAQQRARKEVTNAQSQTEEA